MGTSRHRGAGPRTDTRFDRRAPLDLRPACHVFEQFFARRVPVVLVEPLEEFQGVLQTLADRPNDPEECIWMSVVRRDLGIAMGAVMMMLRPSSSWNAKYTTFSAIETVAVVSTPIAWGSASGSSYRSPIFHLRSASPNANSGTSPSNVEGIR